MKHCFFYAVAKFTAKGGLRELIVKHEDAEKLKPYMRDFGKDAVKAYASNAARMIISSHDFEHDGDMQVRPAAGSVIAVEDEWDIVIERELKRFTLTTKRAFNAWWKMSSWEHFEKHRAAMRKLWESPEYRALKTAQNAEISRRTASVRAPKIRANHQTPEFRKRMSKIVHHALKTLTPEQRIQRTAAATSAAALKRKSHASKEENSK